MTEISLFWLSLAVILGVVEAVTPSLVTVWFAAGALVSAIAAAFGGGIVLQITLFVLVSAVLLATTRPLSKKFVNAKIVATNADRLIGKEGIVLLDIDSIENCGQVRVMGQVWSAKASDGERIERNSRVTVVALEGVRLVVVPKISADKIPAEMKI